MIGDPVNDLLEKLPLIRFSTHTQIQVNDIRELGNEIRQFLEAGITDRGLHSVYGRF